VLAGSPVGPYPENSSCFLTPGGDPMDPAFVIAIIAILIVGAIAWREFGAGRT
jgi:hypothetical protein